jgi:DNA-binding MarR family transcriptional regulator
MQLHAAFTLRGTMTRATSEQLSGLLHEAGIDDATAAAVVEIDALLQNWRRRTLKRELGHRALADLKIGLELAQLDVLFAIEGATEEFGDQVGETMVATVAERLSIDPSRASRLVAELVELGFARRAVSQADARRTIIVLTARGDAVVNAVRAYKLLVMGDFLSKWDRAELAAFIPSLKRFAQWNRDIEASANRFEDEIAQLAEAIAGRQAEPA